MTPTPASQPLFPSLAEFLHGIGRQIGAETPLGAALMDARSATWLVFLLAAGSLLWLLNLAVQRRRLRRESLQLQALMQAAQAGTPAEDGSDRTHREALSALYDMAPSATADTGTVASVRQEPPAEARPVMAGDSNRLEPVLRQEPSPVLPASSVTELFRSAPQPATAMLSVAPAADPAATAASRDVTTGVHAMARHEPDEQHRESASVRLLTQAVDRLLQRVESQQTQIHELVSELKSQSSAVVLQGERLMALEAHVTGLASAPEPAPEPVEQPLEDAISSAAQGLGIEELVSRFGLSEAEARLIHLVHGGDASASGRARSLPGTAPAAPSAPAPGTASGFAVPQADASLTGTDASRA